MATYYEICGADDTRWPPDAIRCGTLLEMLFYVEWKPGYWRLYKVSRRGRRRLMLPTPRGWVASDAIECKCPKCGKRYTADVAHYVPSTCAACASYV